MKVVSENFNEMRTQAKELGINTKGLSKEAIKAAIEEVPNPETRGRKVNPDSARQQRLAKQNTGHRGRPADPNSAWNIRQRELEEKRAKGELKLGRAVNPESARQQRLAKVGTVKRGRPAKVEDTVSVIPTGDTAIEPVETTVLEVVQEEAAETANA